MQANSAERQSFEAPNPVRVSSGLIHGLPEVEEASSEPTLFHGYYANCMEMNASVPTVLEYMNAHRDWFPRCAHPMAVEPLSTNGYALTIGQFGAFGYEVEPKIGLELLPQDHCIYHIQTISIPNYEFQGYSVDFQATMLFTESEPQQTRIDWELNLEVAIHFPRFIHALPKSLVRSTGDRLLNQVVREVSRRLTRKVQQDFHTSIGLPMPKKGRH
ncbi:DUF1997 domain-containing protein [Microcoleus sp. FACHB-1515]|uniref:DUF1997 domain-containing protein n=1 Tax=Cyanophyceae TaxID=3028117 RepID=UPI001684DAD9|nr:DUF1997 domain-containing protein [Microcoleus sp. FACHB-1515]MBD2090105.1 DUF1997 domain-containing protein [Microcoleus sp. FACHB-1515]